MHNSKGLTFVFSSVYASLKPDLFETWGIEIGITNITSQDVEIGMGGDEEC